eukprot:1158923-Pelagomonas_calceolata.AAC.1
MDRLGISLIGWRPPAPGTCSLKGFLVTGSIPDVIKRNTFIFSSPQRLLAKLSTRLAGKIMQALACNFERFLIFFQHTKRG